VVVVLVLAAGAAWESPALTGLADRSDVVVLKRCVDVGDLLATAAAGQADVAVVSLDAPGLDRDAVDHLRSHGVRPVAVLPTGPDLDAAALRATRIGVRAVVADDELTQLGDVVAAGDEPEPTVARATPDGVPEPAQPGRVTVVWGPAGAPGRTTLAVGLAAELGRGRRTILVDADPYGGAVAQQLGIVDEVSGLLAAVRLAAAGQLPERFGSVQRSLDHGSASSPACRGPTAGWRSAPAWSSTSWRSRAATGTSWSTPGSPSSTTRRPRRAGRGATR
jgi:hypothetical protein